MMMSTDSTRVKAPNSDRGPAASGGPTVMANDRNGGRLRLNASRHDDDDYIVTKSPSPAISEIMSTKHIGIMTLTFQVT